MCKECLHQVSYISFIGTHNHSWVPKLLQPWKPPSQKGCWKAENRWGKAMTFQKTVLIRSESIARRNWSVCEGGPQNSLSFFNQKIEDVSIPRPDYITTVRNRQGNPCRLARLCKGNLKVNRSFLQSIVFLDERSRLLYGSMEIHNRSI